ncbi:MAG TPA: ABC transporter permease [Verrucomicrobiae bacterium]|nr:ABC transporter permease [Verrucomicrobiae bacterium]
MRVAAGNLSRRLLRRREAGIFLALIGLMVLIAAYRREFVSPTNLYIVSRQVAFTAIVSLGVFFVILTSGIDLSIGSVVGLSGVLCGIAMAAGVPAWLAVGVGLLTGAVIGAINGGIVAYVGVTSFIVTLGMLSMARGAVLVLTHGDSIRAIPDSFIRVGLADIAGVPVPVVVLAVIAAAAHVVLTYTVFGRRVYAVGGNEEATELSGINVRRVKFFTYVISSTLSSVTGILFIARFRSAQANAGLGMELDAIAATVIGGTSLMGGQGSVLGVLIGATIMGVIRNGLVLMDVSAYLQELIIGAIIVLAATLDVVRSRRRAR